MSPFLEAWLFWSGVVLNITAALAIVWLVVMAVIWPLFEASSLTRCTVKALGKERRNSVWFIWWSAYKDCFGGRNWECVRCNLFTWHGFGDYTIRKGEDDE